MRGMEEAKERDRDSDGTKVRGQDGGERWGMSGGKTEKVPLC